jgi:hypothetical protein
MMAERVAPDELGYLWNTGRVGTAGVVEVAAPGGSRWWADVLDPTRVVAWSAVAGSWDGLVSVFGREWGDRVLPVVNGAVDGTGVELAPPPLSEGWARLVVVLGVRQWSPVHLDEVTLWVDEALAWAGAGDAERAAMTIRMVSGTLVGLVERLTAGGLPTVPAHLVRQACDLALEHLDQEDEEWERLAELRAELEPATVVGDGTLAPTSVQWSTAHHDDVSAGGDKFSVLRESNEGLMLGEVDPTCVTPRILAGAETAQADVRARVEADGVAVEVALVEGIELTDREPASMVAYLADASSGRVLTRAAMRGEGDRLVTTVPLQGHDPAQLVVGVYEAPYADRLRTDPTGRELIHLDRMLLAAWAAARLEACAESPAPHLAESRRDLQQRLNAALATLGSRNGDVAHRADALRRRTGATAWPTLTEALYALRLAKSAVTTAEMDATVVANVPRFATPDRWHLTPQSDFALAASTPQPRDARVDNDARGMRVVRQPLPNGTAYVGVEVRDVGAQPGQILRIWLGREPVPTPLLLVLVDPTTLHRETAEPDVLASECVLPSDDPWPELWVAHLPPVDWSDLTVDDLAAVPRSVACASLPCKEAWRRLAVTLPSDHPLRDAVRAGLS